MALLVSLWQLPLPDVVLLALTALVLWRCGYYWALDANLRMGQSCVAFRLEEGEEIVLVLRNGEHVAGRVMADSLVMPYLVILNVATSERSGGRNLVILPDAMGKDSFRLLCIALRWGTKAVQAAR
ncbi:MAG: hypothetical protein HZB47_00680 [Nitrosomonadales bacterium]|nr:hypothetical protein [Nitrosomonadales bacterium]